MVDTRTVRAVAGLSRRSAPGGAWRRWMSRFCRHGGTYARYKLCDRVQGANADSTPGRLVGACLTDRQGMGFLWFTVSTTHHPTRTGLGTFIILDHIRHAARGGLPYVYLGCWVEDRHGCSTRSASGRWSGSTVTVGCVRSR
jgi:hypothetical protein